MTPPLGLRMQVAARALRCGDAKDPGDPVATHLVLERFGWIARCDDCAAKEKNHTAFCIHVPAIPRSATVAP